MKTLVKQTSYLFCALSLVLFSCTKESGQLNNPNFSAKINGQLTTFMAPVTVQSVKNANGNFELHIIGTERINNDSNIIIKFVIPDFTVTGGTSASHQLNTNFEGNFIEWKSVPGSSYGKYHFFQNGQLSVQQDAHSYLKGSFNFTCFLFDHQGAKTGEVTVTEGNFSDVIIER